LTLPLSLFLLDNFNARSYCDGRNNRTFALGPGRALKKDGFIQTLRLSE
jgi:hypothetical protein